MGRGQGGGVTRLLQEAMGAGVPALLGVLAVSLPLNTGDPLGCGHRETAWGELVSNPTPSWPFHPPPGPWLPQPADGPDWFGLLGEWGRDCLPTAVFQGPTGYKGSPEKSARMSEKVEAGRGVEPGRGWGGTGAGVGLGWGFGVTERCWLLPRWAGGSSLTERLL